MRIPFIPKTNDTRSLIRPELEQFIRKTKAGSPFLLSGATFWLVGAIVSALAPSSKVSYVIYGGIFVPLLAPIIGKLIRASTFSQSPYAILAAIAPVMELAAIPIMIFMQHTYPGALPGVLMICEGVHYLIYMWIHMEYYFFILAYVKVFLGILFLFNIVFAGDYVLQMAISGIVSLVIAILVARDSQRTALLYRKSPV